MYAIAQKATPPAFFPTNRAGGDELTVYHERTTQGRAFRTASPSPQWSY